MKFFSPRQAARLLNTSPATLHRWCQRHDGFALWIDQHWRIPQAHIGRVLEGELSSQIARKPSLPVGAAGEDTARVPPRDVDRAHRQLAVALLFASALAVHSHLPEDARSSALNQVATGAVEALAALGVPGDALREVVFVSGALEEYERVTNIRVEV